MADEKQIDEMMKADLDKWGHNPTRPTSQPATSAPLCKTCNGTGQWGPLPGYRPGCIDCDGTGLAMNYPSWKGELGLQSWHGLSWQAVLVIGETPKRYRIEAIERTKLGGRNRWLEKGHTALVPKHAIRASCDSPVNA